VLGGNGRRLVFLSAGYCGLDFVSDSLSLVSSSGCSKSGHRGPVVVQRSSGSSVEEEIALSMLSWEFG
jgi:hypothetical protein